MLRLRTVVDIYIYIYKLDARLDSLAFAAIRDQTPVEITTLAPRRGDYGVPDWT